MEAEIDNRKGLADQPRSRVANDKLSWFGNLLQARRKIWRDARDRFGINTTLTNEIADDHLASRDADACFHAFNVTVFEGANSLNDFEAGTDGAFCLILVSLWPAEIGENPVTKVFRNMATISGNRARDGVLVVADHVAQIFRIESRRQGSGPDHVDEHDRELPPLGTVERR